MLVTHVDESYMFCIFGSFSSQDPELMLYYTASLFTRSMMSTTKLSIIAHENSACAVFGTLPDHCMICSVYKNCIWTQFIQLKNCHGSTINWWWLYLLLYCSDPLPLSNWQWRKGVLLCRQWWDDPLLFTMQFAGADIHWNHVDFWSCRSCQMAVQHVRNSKRWVGCSLLWNHPIWIPRWRRFWKQEQMTSMPLSWFEQNWHW